MKYINWSGASIGYLPKSWNQYRTNSCTYAINKSSDISTLVPFVWIYFLSYTVVYIYCLKLILCWNINMRYNNNLKTKFYSLQSYFHIHMLCNSLGCSNFSNITSVLNWLPEISFGRAMAEIFHITIYQHRVAPCQNHQANLLYFPQQQSLYLQVNSEICCTVWKRITKKEISESIRTF